MLKTKSQIKNKLLGYGLFILYRLKLALRRLGVERIPGVPAAYTRIKRLILPSGTVLVKGSDSLLYADLADEVMTPTFIGKVRPRYELELFKSLLRPGMVVLDVGANIGYFTVAAARGAGRSGKVYAFEPEPHNFELLLKNIDLNGLVNVTAARQAVSDREGSRGLFVSKYNLGSHSFGADNAPDSLSRIEVETITLDGWRARVLDGKTVDLIKVDCQGAESLIVEGARGLLSEGPIKLIMEFWPFGLKTMGSGVHELAQKLESLGFEMRVVDEETRSLEPLDPETLDRMCAVEGESGKHFGILAERR